MTARVLLLVHLQDAMKLAALMQKSYFMGRKADIIFVFSIESADVTCIEVLCVLLEFPKVLQLSI